MIDGRTPGEIARDDARFGGGVRYRAMDTSLGRWTRQDPTGYVDGSSLYATFMSSPTTYLDPLGLEAEKQERVDPDVARRKLKTSICVMKTLRVIDPYGAQRLAQLVDSGVITTEPMADDIFGETKNGKMYMNELKLDELIHLPETIIHELIHWRESPMVDKLGWAMLEGLGADGLSNPAEAGRAVREALAGWEGQMIKIKCVPDPEFCSPNEQEPKYVVSNKLKFAYFVCDPFSHNPCQTGYMPGTGKGDITDLD